MTAATVRKIEAATAIEKKESHMFLSSISWFLPPVQARQSSGVNADRAQSVPAGVGFSTEESLGFKEG